MPAPRFRPLACLIAVVMPGCRGPHIEDLPPGHDTSGTTGTPAASTTGTETGTDASDTTRGLETASTGDSASAGTGGLAGTTADAVETTTDASTGAPAAVCGDGVVAGDEECDDQNDIASDGCLSDCRRTWIVFVTSEPYTQGDMNGLIGADYQCRHRAAKQFLPNGERYKAWLSTSEVNAADRLYHARGPYVLIDGTQVAASWDALVTGPLDHAIDLTELDETVYAPVFTGTLPDGLAVPDSSHCDDWTDNNVNGINFGWFGVTGEVNQDWTFAVEAHCGGGAGLYCFEQP